MLYIYIQASAKNYMIISERYSGHIGYSNTEIYIHHNEIIASYLYKGYDKYLMDET